MPVRKGSVMAGPQLVSVLSPFALYRRAWQALLESLTAAACVQTARIAAEIAVPGAGERPLTILVDAPGCEQELALELAQVLPHCPALFVVNDYDLDTILPLLKQGVSGFTARSDSVVDLERALRTTAGGGVGLPLAVAKQAMVMLVNGGRSRLDQPCDLTRRETEVLELLSGGLSNRDIAQTLFLSVRTVEAHLRSLYGKLNVSSRTEAALWAVRQGYASSL